MASNKTLEKELIDYFSTNRKSRIEKIMARFGDKYGIQTVIDTLKLLRENRIISFPGKTIFMKTTIKVLK